MLISLCIPIHNRTHDFRKVLPYLLEAANYSPPIEIVVVDYNSQDDLRGYMRKAMEADLEHSNSITYKRYTGRDHYHMAHARNLSVLASHGKYFTISSADIYFTYDFFADVRSMLAKHQYDWLYDQRYKGVIVCKRDEFIAAGGYDERFEFYGPEDRDLHDRLLRRGLSVGVMLGGQVKVIETPNKEKVKNYRLPLSKREMKERMHPIYFENCENKVMVANPEGWGRWT